MPTVVELKKTIKAHKTTKCPAISKMKKADLLKFVKENNIKLQPPKETNVKLQSAYKKDKYGKTLIDFTLSYLKLLKPLDLTAHTATTLSFFCDASFFGSGKKLSTSVQGITRSSPSNLVNVTSTTSLRSNSISLSLVGIPLRSATVSST